MKLSIDLAAGETLHVFLKPLAPAQTAAAQLTEPSGAVAELVGPASDDFTQAVHVAAGSGQALLAWDEAGTAISLVYAFDPARVMKDGIRVLLTTERNAANRVRHRLHLAPPFGWMNDPNGLSEHDGLTHLFYQHYPHSQRWNTMHWGHAVSRNKIDWVHLPIFLMPRPEILGDDGKSGGAFSGSAMTLPDGRLRVFYTDREDDREPNWEWQLTAISNDWLDPGPSAALITDRPAVPNYRKDFRDPYVFRGPDGRLKMLLGGGDGSAALVLLYDTADPEGADGWTFSGVLHAEPSRQALPAECPCMVALDGEGAGLHVLIFGLLGSRDDITRRRNITVAIVGRFDGNGFSPIARQELDYGTDCYAFQGIDGADGPFGIAWAANWTDVFKDKDFPSAMTFPRRLIWCDGHLSTPPVESVEGLREAEILDGRLGYTPIALTGGLAEIELDFGGRAPAFELALRHPTHRLALRYDGTTLELDVVPPGNRPVPRYMIEDVAVSRLRIFIDVGLIEIYVDEGRWCLTKRLESDEAVESVAYHADGDGLVAARIWRLRAI